MLQARNWAQLGKYLILMLLMHAWLELSSAAYVATHVYVATRTRVVQSLQFTQHRAPVQRTNKCKSINAAASERARAQLQDQDQICKACIHICAVQACSCDKELVNSLRTRAHVTCTSSHVRERRAVRTGLCLTCICTPRNPILQY